MVEINYFGEQIIDSETIIKIETVIGQLPKENKIIVIYEVRRIYERLKRNREQNVGE